jgi:hypothetical protein
MQDLCHNVIGHVVSFSMASHFNEKVVIDMKCWRGTWILYMIDMWSRYTVSIFITRCGVVLEVTILYLDGIPTSPIS